MHQETFKGVEITAPTKLLAAHIREVIAGIMFPAEDKFEEFILAEGIVRNFEAGIICFNLLQAGVRIRLAEMLKSPHD
jgi:hypothetical protein